MGNYNTAALYATNKQGWLSGDNQTRYAVYDFYDDLYANSPEQYKLLLRGDEPNPIYIPTAKKVIKTLARYIARDFGFTIEGVSGSELEEVAAAYQSLFDREEFFTTFSTGKRKGLRRGDQCIYIWADTTKPEGRRLTIEDLDPRRYFPIYNDDKNKLTGCDIIDQVVEGDDTFISIRRYMRPTHPSHSAFDEEAPDWESPIEYTHFLLELQNWETEPKVVRTVVAQIALEGITSLPVYHIKYNNDGDGYFGVSSLSGTERLCLAINQAMTDEHTAVVMAGLGMYKAGGSPIDENGNRTQWVIGPKQVVEDSEFDRVAGITSVQPSQDHMNFMDDAIQEALALNDVATGKVDSTVAESGIALAIRMGPLLDETNEIDNEIISKMLQFFHDLKAWFENYEGITIPEEAVIIPDFAEKLPQNIQEEFNRLQDLFANSVISMQTYHEKLAELGFTLPEDEAKRIAKEREEAMAAFDPYGGRVQDEASGGAPADDQPPQE